MLEVKGEVNRMTKISIWVSDPALTKKLFHLYVGGSLEESPKLLLDKVSRDQRYSHCLCMNAKDRMLSYWPV
uniref:Uncharacterized protein n=1 Tax=Arion vulgaris TaxID=1028688 RepID=A0A0B6Z4M0_9EUPU